MSGIEGGSSCPMYLPCGPELGVPFACPPLPGLLGEGQFGADVTADRALFAHEVGVHLALPCLGPPAGQPLICNTLLCSLCYSWTQHSSSPCLLGALIMLVPAVLWDQASIHEGCSRQLDSTAAACQHHQAQYGPAELHGVLGCSATSSLIQNSRAQGTSTSLPGQEASHPMAAVCSQ